MRRWNDSRRTSECVESLARGERETEESAGLQRPKLDEEGVWTTVHTLTVASAKGNTNNLRARARGRGQDESTLQVFPFSRPLEPEGVGHRRPLFALPIRVQRWAPAFPSPAKQIPTIVGTAALLISISGLFGHTICSRELGYAFSGSVAASHGSCLDASRYNDR